MTVLKTNSITNTAEHFYKSWAVNWFLKNFSIGFPCRLFFLFFFYFGGGGGGCKKCWVTGKTIDLASLARFPL